MKKGPISANKAKFTNQKSNNDKSIFIKKFLAIFSYYVYIFLLIGLVFHTSSHPTIFGKYTTGYTLLLIFLVFLFVPFILLVKFTLRTTNISIKNKEIKLQPYKKIILYAVIVTILIIIPTETILRIKKIHFTKVKGTYTIENFHPFLQQRIIPSMGPSYHANEYGFRAGPISKEKPKNTYRIFLLGGSTVLNVSTPFEQNTSELLRKLLQKKYPQKNIEVINAGNEGYTSEHSIIDYMFNISDFQPDLVIMWHGINDMQYSCVPTYQSFGIYHSDYSHFLGAVTNMVKSYYTEKPIISINLISMDFITEFFRYNFYSDLIEAYKKMQFNKHGKVLNSTPIAMNYPSMAAYKRNLEHFAKILKEDNVSFVLGNQPFLYRKELDKTMDWYMQHVCSDGVHHPSLESLIRGINGFNKTTEKVALENHVPFIDLERHVPKTATYFVDDVHLNSKGNQLTADLLYDFVIDNKIINYEQ